MRMRDGFLLEVVFFYDVIRTNRLLKWISPKVLFYGADFYLLILFLFLIKCHLSACWKLIEDGSVFVFFFPFSLSLFGGAMRYVWVA